PTEAVDKVWDNLTPPDLRKRGKPVKPAFSAILLCTQMVFCESIENASSFFYLFLWRKSAQIALKKM
ncbi:hypothetical protein EGH82_19090, partial [Vibrio ponticus]